MRRNLMISGASICYAPDVVISGSGEGETSSTEVAMTAAVAEHIATETAEDVEELETQVDNLERSEAEQWQDLSRLQSEVSDLKSKVEQLLAGQVVTVEVASEALATAETALEVATEEAISSEEALEQPIAEETITSETLTETSSETRMEAPEGNGDENHLEAPPAEVVKRSRVRML